ncbi:MAG: peptidoglycan-associated lipoprotein Pal [Candidatus Pelagibacter sp.]|tara:strand:+ start:85 stop:579 length:495 start_codon:yes stop_codon:yes gene_type:complete
MNLSNILKNTFLVIILSLVVSACASKKTTTTSEIGSQIQGDVFTGTDTVEYLAKGVPDRVFFATNESILTTMSRDTLRKQAAWLRENSSVNIVVEGHADERGTREYNLALGERRANAAKDYLMTYGISADRISVISYGKERPVDSGSNPLSWSKNRRSVSVKAN